MRILLRGGEVLCNGNRKYNIVKSFDVEDRIIITIAGTETANKIAKELILKGINIITLEDILGKENDKVSINRGIIADYHKYAMSDYFDNAELIDNISIFWSENSPFKIFFDYLDLTNVIELACGKGRHVMQYIDKAGAITLVDILAENIDDCKRRFSKENKILYLNNNGYDIHELGSGLYTALFTYDAMVHFELLDIFNYLKETYRVLKTGGRALFHHSNNTEDYKVNFLSGMHGRNYMNSSLFAYLANRAGLTILDQKIIPWGKVQSLDCITLVEKK